MNRTDFAEQRRGMVSRLIAGHGVRSQRVLDAMRCVPREAFLPVSQGEFAYEEMPLPDTEGQANSQPYIVALMTEALALQGGEKVLEIGTGSGYAAAVLSRIARSVYTVERIEQLAAKAAATLAALAYHNVHVLHADGTLGWLDHAPYDAIAVAAGGPTVPEALKAQLKIGGRLVMPVGPDRERQELVRVIRLSALEYKTEDIADVRFVPLVGEQGWGPQGHAAPTGKTSDAALATVIAAACERFDSIDSANLEPLMRRIGEARVVLLGESSHGSSEFHRMRERISRELVKHKGFSFIAIEGDWPDAARIDHYVRHAQYRPAEWTAFARFPVWMWRNREVREFVDWLRTRNATLEAGQRVAFHGLDLYSLYNSVHAILNYLDDVDPASAQLARQRYGCLTPWQADPAAYGQAALSGCYQSCEPQVLAMLRDLTKKHLSYAADDGERFLDAVQNARLVASAERYYRTMFYGSRASWNLRDSHMFDTLSNLLDFHGPGSKAIVWAHNSHVGDSEATEMSLRGEHNIGHLCRQAFGDAAYLVGFGTHGGTVAAASNWGEPMEVKSVRAALPGSYEQLCHDSGVARFFLPLRTPRTPDLVPALMNPRLERAIGVIYRPETERHSHYFQAVLPRQFDEYIWFDETQAVTPLHSAEIEGFPDTYPFGL